jgi:ribose transport system substrate-binding protein
MGLAVVCLLAALALSACGGGSDSTSSGGGSETSETSETSESGGGETAANVPFKSVEEEAAAEYPEPKSGKFHLAYMNPAAGNEFLKTLGTSMKLETEKLGGSYSEVAAKGDPNEQVSQMDQLLAQGVDGIAVFALDPGALAPVVEKAKKQGVKLVTIDLNLAEPGLKGLAGYESQVWQRRDFAAYLTGKYMAEHLEPGAEVGTIEFGIKVPSIVFSIERDVYWAEKMGLKNVGSTANKTDDIAGGEPAMTQLLNEHPEIKGVMAYNDPTAIGAYAAARSAGITDLILGGENGGSEARSGIEGGRETFSILLDVPSMGKDFAWGLYDLLQGTKVPPTVIAGEPILMDKENVAETPTWQETLEQEYGTSE